MTARVVYIGAPEADAQQFVVKARPDFGDLNLFATNDRQAALDHVGDAEVIIGHHFQFDEALIQRAAKLRWIQSLTTGTDAILKLPLRPDIVVTSTRGMHGPQMSELVFLQMLALNRNFARMLNNQREARWERWPQSLLADKTAVIVGVGAIAEALAPRCRAFGMKVFGISSSPRVPPGFDGVFSREELTQAASVADFLILIVPYSAATDNLIDAQVIKAMKPSAYLINVARGGVLDENALIAALREKRIAGAALDVFRQIPLPKEDPLWREPNVIITPLVGGMSDVYLDQAYPVVRDNLKHFLANEFDRMINVVTR